MPEENWEKRISTRDCANIGSAPDCVKSVDRMRAQLECLRREHGKNAAGILGGDIVRTSRCGRSGRATAEAGRTTGRNAPGVWDGTGGGTRSFQRYLCRGRESGAGGDEPSGS